VYKQALLDEAERLLTRALELSGRRDQLKEWLEDKSNDKPILAVQIQAGGVGIDLTRSRYGIYYSLGFSLGDYLQSLARIHRPGQTRPVAYYHLLIRGTVDEIIMRALAARQNVVDSVLEELRCKPMKLKTGT
jgi:SNF2 family DNA or RNA helicase